MAYHLFLSNMEEVSIMRKSYSSMSYDRFLKDLRDEIHYSSEYTQDNIAPLLNIRRETLCRKLNGGNLSAEELYKILIILGIL